MPEIVQRPSHVSAPRPRTAWALWFGILAGPFALLYTEQILYVTAFWGCGQFGSVAPVLLHLTPFVLILVTAAAGVVAWRHRTMPLESAEDVSAEDKKQRGFMAVLGVGMSFLFGLALIAQWIPVFFLDACSRT